MNTLFDAIRKLPLDLELLINEFYPKCRWDYNVVMCQMGLLESKGGRKNLWLRAKLVRCLRMKPMNEIGRQMRYVFIEETVNPVFDANEWPVLINKARTFAVRCGHSLSEFDDSARVNALFESFDASIARSCVKSREAVAKARSILDVVDAAADVRHAAVKAKVRSILDVVDAAADALHDVRHAAVEAKANALHDAIDTYVQSRYNAVEDALRAQSGDADRRAEAAAEAAIEAGDEAAARRAAARRAAAERAARHAAIDTEAAARHAAIGVKQTAIAAIAARYAARHAAIDAEAAAKHAAIDAEAD